MEYGTDELALILDLLEKEKEGWLVRLAHTPDNELEAAKGHVKVLNGAIKTTKNLLLPVDERVYGEWNTLAGLARAESEVYS